MKPSAQLTQSSGFLAPDAKPIERRITEAGLSAEVMGLWENEGGGIRLPKDPGLGAKSLDREL
jgi:hypothetical protein